MRAERGAHPRDSWQRTLIAASLALTLAQAVLPSPAHAQRLDLDVRGTGGIPITRFAGAELEAGIGFGATAAVRVASGLFIYAGWDRVQLSGAESFAGTDRTFRESGYAMGVRVEYPMSAPIHYRLEVGPTFRGVAIVDHHGDLVVDSDDDWGLEASAGLILPLSAAWKMTPSGRLRWMTTDFSWDGERIEGVLRYVALDFGLSYLL